MPDPTGIDPATIAVAAILVATVGVVGASMIASWVNTRRRQTASLSAIDFVRASFVTHVVHGEPMDEVLLDTVESLRGALRLEAAEIWLADSTMLRLAAADPGRTADGVPLTSSLASILCTAPVSGRPWLGVWLPALLSDRAATAQRVAPISVTGELIGLLLIARTGPEDRLASDADDTLAELARELGSALKKQRLDAALHASMDRLRQQADDLRASRARIVAAADAERRRIERDLHDGAQQYLVAIAVKANLIQELSGRDEPKRRALLQELTVDIQSALDELRDLAHGIYPPLLSSAGLAQALAAACRRAPLATALDADGIGRYPPAIEAAVYFCCLEGLQNAAKYAGDGAAARLRLTQEPDCLTFEVLDDGAGFDPAAVPPGAGLTHMADRIGAVGGTLTVDSSPGGGTRIDGSIPLAGDP